MSNVPHWLPRLIPFEDYKGDWELYLEAIYRYFKKDFIDSSPVFQGNQLKLKRHPVTNGKEATFWHFIQSGESEGERIPDLRRCERIRWPKAIIENDTDPLVKVWRNKRGNEERICLWFTQESYLVVLADRGKYILPWTAYPVEQPHRQRKLQKEYERYRSTG